MNSMLRQYQISIQDLSDYLKSYDPADRIEPETWVKSTSLNLKPGSLIFCLESIANAGDTNTSETFRVKDLCATVCLEDGRAQVLDITSGAYELRFFESLIVEKAKKAILSGKPFSYVIAHLAKSLPEAASKKVEKLRSTYAQGGSRRNVLSEKGGASEPLSAFLSALGIELDLPNGKKQLLEIGSICHMIFVSAHDEEDKNRNVLRSWFQAEPAKASLGESKTQSEIIAESDSKTMEGVSVQHVQPMPKLHWEAAAMELDPDTITGDNLVVQPAMVDAPTKTEAGLASQMPTSENLVTAPPASNNRLQSSAPQTIGEPKLVMTEMALFMSKLEQQVSKGAKKLASRAEEIERRLNGQLDALLEEANQDDKNIKAPILVLCESLAKQFQELSNKLHEKILETANTGKDSIKNLFASNQSQLENDKGVCNNSLAKDCQEFREKAKTLSKSSEDELKTLGQDKIRELETMLKETFEQLRQTGEVFEQRLKQRFERFQDRMAEETQSVLNALERNASAMQEEIDSSWERAAEKLASSKTDFELSIEHTLKTAELSISQSTRTLLVEQFLPKLRERRGSIASAATEMCKNFSGQSHTQSDNQLDGLTTSLNTARKHLQTLAQECLAKLELGGREKQSGLEEVFKESSAHIESSTQGVTTELEKTEAIIKEGESVCKNLAETSSLDTNPALTEKHAQAWAQVEKSQSQASAALNHNLETSCIRLENYAQNFQTQLNSFRLDEIQQVRNDCENGLNRIRESIQETLSAIQAAREKAME